MTPLSLFDYAELDEGIRIDIQERTPHVLRHTFGVTCVRKGMSLVTVQKLLGHDRIETTMIDLNLLPEDVMRDFEEKW